MLLEKQVLGQAQGPAPTRLEEKQGGSIIYFRVPYLTFNGMVFDKKVQLVCLIWSQVAKLNAAPSHQSRS
jgi:hypothetical protein